MNELLEEISECPHVRVPEIETEENSIKGCNSRTWIAIVDAKIVGYSESAFVNGVLHYLIDGGSLEEVLPLLTYQRQAGVSAIYAKLTKLRAL